MTIAEVLGLLIAIVVVATVADRLRIAYPILLVIAGLVVAILPLAHRVTLQPDLILLVFLPPLIYDASLDTSARDLRTHWRPILLLAVGLVLATMTLVAVVFHLLVPQSTWGEAFALGAIVSPPDSVAATQIAGKLGLPRRLVTILGGEGLMNDATALTAYQVAVASVATTLTVTDVAARFLFAVVAGVAIGLAVGWAGTRMLRLVETPVIENTVLLILPFAAYLPADKLDASGVLAVVAAGLYFGRYGSRSLTAAARLQQRQIWELVVFLLTGLSFLLVGLELRPVLETLDGPLVGLAGGRVAGRGRRGDRAAHGLDVRRHGTARGPPPVQRQPADTRRRGARPRWSGGPACGAPSAWPPPWPCRRRSPSGTSCCSSPSRSSWPPWSARA